MNTERKEAARVAEAAKAPSSESYLTIKVSDASVFYVKPDQNRTFLVISGRPCFPGDGETLVFAHSSQPNCWIQVSELKGIVKPEHAVTSLLLSSRGQRTAIDDLNKDLKIARDACWQALKEKQSLVARRQKSREKTRRS